MYRILCTEFLKIKKAKILLLIPISSLIPVLLMLGVYISETGQSMRSAGWGSYLGHLLVTLCDLTPPVFILFTGFIFSREYSDHTMDCMITYPISRVGILVSKMLVMVPVVLLIMFLSFASGLVLGEFLVYDSLSLAIIVEYSKIYLLISIFQLALVPTAAIVSIISKDIIASAVAALAEFLVFIAFLNTKYNVFFPWCVPTLFSSRWGKYQYLEQGKFNVSIALITLTITFVLALVINVIYYRKTELIAK